MTGEEGGERGRCRETDRKHWIFLARCCLGQVRAERSSVSGVNRQLHVQIGCKLVIRNRKNELTKQAKRSKLQIKPEGN